jgi:hypothetical protein
MGYSGLKSINIHIKNIHYSQEHGDRTDEISTAIPGGAGTENGLIVGQHFFRPHTNNWFYKLIIYLKFQIFLKRISNGSQNSITLTLILDGLMYILYALYIKEIQNDY